MSLHLYISLGIYIYIFRDLFYLFVLDYSYLFVFLSYFIFFYLDACLLSNERETKKGYRRGLLEDGEDLKRTEEGKIIIRTYCIKNYLQQKI